jgi:small nuclear ribonucleoprotein (snRNP)-like protein
MKKLLLAITLVFLLLLAGVPSHQAAMEDTGAEVTGVIKNVSVNVNLIVVEVSEQDRKDESVKSESNIKSVSVQPHTKITVNGKEATIKDLQAGQPVKVRLETESSKAISIEAGTVMAENH